MTTTDGLIKLVRTKLIFGIEVLYFQVADKPNRDFFRSASEIQSVNETVNKEQWEVLESCW